MPHCDLLVFGTGTFAARQLFDLAATASQPLTIACAGRNRERLDWIALAARARAAIYGRTISVSTFVVDIDDEGSVDEVISSTMPRVIVQSASAQGSSTIGSAASDWDRLINVGGYSITTPLQALFSLRIAESIDRVGCDAAFINSSFPDVVNTILAALRLPITCGVGNVAILASVFSSAEAPGEIVRVLAPYQTIAPWRQSRELRTGPVPRVWIGDQEIRDVLERFSNIRLTVQPVIEISGATGVPLIAALATGGDWVGHAPGPYGLPGGYPLRISHGKLSLDLPAGISVAEAVNWNDAFERKDGAYVSKDRLNYVGSAQEALRSVGSDLANGFRLDELKAAAASMAELRQRLQR
jgi:hypothetical protein